MRSYESIRVGDSAQLSRAITQRDIDRFVELTGDDNKLHVDAAFAGTTRFKKPVAHGMLGASFISTVIGTKLPGDGALWFAQNLEFLQPVRVGDTITVRAQVVRKSDAHRIIELTTDIFNQSRQKVTTGTAKVRVLGPEKNGAAHESRGAAKPAAAPRLKTARKTALVVGGTGGIGSAVALQLARDGFDVAVHYRRSSEAARTLARTITGLGRKALALGSELETPAQAEELIASCLKRLGGLTTLVHCGGGDIPNIRLRDLGWDSVQEQLDTHVKTAFLLQKFAVPAMAERRYGKIVFLTSQAVERPSPQWLHYITAKAALSGMAKAMAVELAPLGIRVNLVSPGMTDTPLISSIPEKARLLAEAQTPLQRIARPEDVAGAVSFLVSEKSNFLTGETIRVNGGQVML